MSDHGRWSFLHIAAKAAFNYHWYALFSTVTFLLLKLTYDMTLSSTVSLLSYNHFTMERLYSKNSKTSTSKYCFRKVIVLNQRDPNLSTYDNNLVIGNWHFVLYTFRVRYKLNDGHLLNNTCNANVISFYQNKGIIQVS